VPSPEAGHPADQNAGAPAKEAGLQCLSLCDADATQFASLGGPPAEGQ